MTFTSADPVDRALLIRTGAHTHSLAFDLRAAWLEISSNAGGSVTLKTPGSRNVLPPGM